MICSRATVYGVVGCFGVNSIYVVLACPTQHPVLTTSALQEVSVGSATQRRPRRDLLLLLLLPTRCNIVLRGTTIGYLIGLVL